MRRKRKSLIILILVLICLLSSACSKINININITTEDDSKTSEEASNEDVKITEEVVETTEDSEAVVEDTVKEPKYEANETLRAKLGRGINIGNSLDCYDEWNDNAVITETYWGNPEITEEYVDLLIKSGFKTIRIPITWSSHIHNNKIDDDFMRRVKEVVDYAYNKNANVIIDIHHDKKFSPSYGNYDASKAYLENVWGQVCQVFKDYDDRLIFEGINEPRFYGTSDEWTDGTNEGAEVTNKLMADFVNVVRNSGGNNATRLLLVAPYCNRSGSTALDRMVIPQDDNIAVAIHSYDPYEFTSSDWNRDFDDNFKGQFDYTINNLQSFVKDRGVPVVITEWGTYESVGKNGRIGYLNYALTKYDQAGIPTVWWDNGNCYENGAYGLFNRWNLQPYDQDVLNAIIKEY